MVHFATTPYAPVPTALRVYRAAAGLSEEALADRAGLSRNTISRLERGLHKPRRETVQAIAGALGRSPSAVFPPGVDDGS